MTQVNTKRGSVVQTVLSEVLRTIATTSEPRSCIPRVLEAVQSVIGANGGCLLLFQDPRLLVLTDVDEKDIPSDSQLKALANSLPQRIQVNPTLPEDVNFDYDGWLVGQIRLENQVVGVLWFVFDSIPEFDAEQQAALEMLADALTIVTMNVRLVARHEKLGRNQTEFMRVVSHDLRSPLTSMHGFASMLESGMVGDMNEKQAHFVDKILSGINQMTSLVDNIQDAGRFDPETGFYEMERSPCDVTELVQRILKNHLVPAEKQELALTAVIADDIPIVNIDANMLERAITNLVDNAIKYTPNGRNVEAAVRRADDHILVSVKDNGLGISPENQKLLFERHVRIPRKEHKRIKGSGLGLFIVRSVARRHGGDAWVESAEGEGSTFCISIPLNEANSIGADGSNA